MVGRVTKAEAFADLKRVAGRLGHPPTIAEYREHGKYSCPTVAKHFDGSFKTARAAALDVPDNRLAEHRREELLADIERVAEMVDREPSKTDYEEHGDYALSTITYRFESWIAAKEEADVYDGLDETVTKEELLNDMERVDQEIDGPLSQLRYNKHGKWTTRPVKRRFSSWEKACQKAGVSRPNMGPRPADDKELLADIRNVANELDHVPSRSEYNEEGRFSRQMAINRFGSWPKAVEKAGYDPLPPGGQSGERNALWADEEPYYGPDWEEQAEEIRERDNYECQNCGMTNAEHTKEYESKLNVHHIKKARNFNNYQTANSRENLITLCNSCHTKIGVVLNHIQAPRGDVDRMVADAFEISHGQEEPRNISKKAFGVDRAGRLLAAQEITDDRLGGGRTLLVDQVVALGEVVTQLAVLVGIGDHGVFDHLGDRRADGLDVDLRQARSVGRQRVLREVDREIADPFEIGDDLERGGNKAEIRGDWLLERDQVDAVGFEIEILLVDFVVPVDHLLGQRLVGPFEGSQCKPESVEDEFGHIQHVLPQGIEAVLVRCPWHTDSYRISPY